MFSNKKVFRGADIYSKKRDQLHLKSVYETIRNRLTERLSFRMFRGVIKMKALIYTLVFLFCCTFDQPAEAKTEETRPIWQQTSHSGWLNQQADGYIAAHIISGDLVFIGRIYCQLTSLRYYVSLAWKPGQLTELAGTDCDGNSVWYDINYIEKSIALDRLPANLFLLYLIQIQPRPK